MLLRATAHQQPATAAPDVPDADARTTGVLAVLGGVSPSVVARRLGVAESVLDRWVATFIAAGREGIAGQGGAGGAHKDRHLGVVAHELRSPLAMIRGWAELLQANAAPEVTERATAGILSQVDRLSRLAEDALDATSVALGRLDLDRQDLHLAPLVLDIIRARSMDHPDVLVADDPVVSVDPHRLGQVVDNLLENVRKHAPGTARVAIGRRGRHGEVVISSDGAPIPQDLARRMFEPFERGQSAGEGTGLGLYVCRSLVQAHGGEMGLKVDGAGNHFWVRLPVVEA